jgi:hypothetical protein
MFPLKKGENWKSDEKQEEASCIFHNHVNALFDPVKFC